MNARPQKSAREYAKADIVTIAKAIILLVAKSYFLVVNFSDIIKVARSNAVIIVLADVLLEFLMIVKAIILLAFLMINLIYDIFNVLFNVTKITRLDVLDEFRFSAIGIAKAD